MSGDHPIPPPKSHEPQIPAVARARSTHACPAEQTIVSTPMGRPVNDYRVYPATVHPLIIVCSAGTHPVMTRSYSVIDKSPPLTHAQPLPTPLVCLPHHTACVTEAFDVRQDFCRPVLCAREDLTVEAGGSGESWGRRGGDER